MELFLDLETSINNTTVGNNRASPFDKSNQIVAWGWQYSNESNPSTSYMEDVLLNLDNVSILVGHNLAFDLSWLLTRQPDHWYEWLRSGGQLWDTQIAEYILTNLRHQFPSLDDTCIKYGGTVKDSRMKSYWEAGIKTEDIPYVELIPYLEGDITNTRVTYLGQLKKAQELGMLNIIRVRMKALRALISMHINGMSFDVQFARQEACKLAVTLTKLKKDALEIMRPFFVEEFNVNPSSPSQISIVLFGGSYKYKRLGPVIENGSIVYKKDYVYENVTDGDGNVVIYKSGPKKGEIKKKKVPIEGEVKTKLYDYTKHTTGLCLKPKEDWYSEKTNLYSTTDDVLTSLLERDKISSTAKDFIKLILEIRKLDKDLGTYFLGYPKLVWPGTSLIHPNFNTCLTVTGRLSSSSPNMQNLSSSSED